MPAEVDVSVGVYVPDHVDLARPVSVFLYKSGWNAEYRTDNIHIARDTYDPSRRPWNRSLSYVPGEEFPDFVDFMTENDVWVDIPTLMPFPAQVHNYTANGIERVQNPFHAGSNTLHADLLVYLRDTLRLDVESVSFGGTSNGAFATIHPADRAYSNVVAMNSFYTTGLFRDVFTEVPLDRMPWLTLERDAGRHYIWNVQAAGFEVRSIVVCSGLSLYNHLHPAFASVLRGRDASELVPKLMYPVSTFYFADADDPYWTQQVLSPSGWWTTIDGTARMMARAWGFDVAAYTNTHYRRYDYDVQYKGVVEDNGARKHGTVAIDRTLYLLPAERDFGPIARQSRSRYGRAEFLFLRFTGNVRGRTGALQHGPSSIADLYGNLDPLICFYNRHVHGKSCVDDWFTWSGDYTNNIDASLAPVDVPRIRKRAVSDPTPGPVINIAARGFTDAEHFYVQSTYGALLERTVGAFETLSRPLDGSSQSNIDEINPLIDVSGNHRESIFGRVDVYDKETMRLVRSRRMVDMWTEYMGANVDEFGVSYPRPVDWDTKDVRGEPTIIDNGPFATGLSIAQGHPSDPLANDFLYMYNGNWHHLTVAKVRKSDLSIVTATELHGGKVDGLANLWWGKGITVLPSDPASPVEARRYPRVVVHTSAHVLYETYHYSLLRKQPYFSRINPGAIRPIHNTSGMVFCFLDRGDRLEKLWEFPVSPRNLQASETLPSSVFPDDLSEPDSYYRILYGMSGLEGIQQRHCVDWSGRQRVALKPLWRNATVTQVNGYQSRREWPEYVNAEGTGAVRGYVYLCDRSTGDCAPRDWYVLYRATHLSEPEECVRVDELVRADDDLRTNADGCVEVRRSYLMHVNHPIVLKLYRRCVGELTLDEQMAHGLNFRGGGSWQLTLTWDRDTDTLYETTSSYDFIPLEEQIRARIARNAVPGVPDATHVEAGMGLDGMVVPRHVRDDIWFANEESHRKKGTDDAEELFRFGTSLNYVDWRNDYKAVLTSSGRFSRFKGTVASVERSYDNVMRYTMSPRAARFLASGAFALRASDGALKWGVSFTRGLNGYFRPGTIRTSTEVNGEYFLYACGRNNIDVSTGITIYSTPDANDDLVKRGALMIQKSDRMVFFNISADSFRVQPVSGDSTPQMVEGIASGYNDSPFLRGATPLDDIYQSGVNANGMMRGPQGYGRALRGKWGQIASNGRYFVHVNTYEFALTRRNNILFEWNGTHHVERYPGLTASEIEQRIDPKFTYHNAKVVTVDGKVHIAWDSGGDGYRLYESAIYLIIGVHDALTLDKIWDIVYFEEAKPVRQALSSAGPVTFFNDDVISFTDYTKRSKFINVVTGNLVNILDLEDADDLGYGDPLGPTVDGDSLIFTRTKMSVLDVGDATPTNESFHDRRFFPSFVKWGNVAYDSQRMEEVPKPPSPPAPPPAPKPPPAPVDYSGST